MLNQFNPSNDKPRTVQDIIRAIEARSADGIYIYRGEPECYENISSNLYRELEAVKARYSSIRTIQDDIVAAARAYTDKTGYFDILTEMQHYGGRTNLIDFTTDFNVALFFACYGSPAQRGRVIVLQETDELKKIRHKPQTPEIRVRAQKSVFVEPPKGYIDLEHDVICIPTDLKLLMLQYLRGELEHEISPKTIYNDIHGFIRSQNDNWMAYRYFYDGLSLDRIADEAKTLKEKQQACAKAIDRYTNALERNLQASVVYNNRGAAYDKISQLGLAIKDYDKATQLNPNYSEPFNNRGVAYNKKGKFNLALADLNTAVKLKPNDAQVYNNRGLAYFNTGELNLALLDVDTAIELDPCLAGAYNTAGMVYWKKGERGRAIKAFSKSIELKSDDVEAVYNRGEAYGLMGEYDHAIKDFTKALQLKSGDIESHLKRGMAYRGNSNYERAVKDFSRVIGLEPENAIAYYYRGEARLPSRQWTDAKSDLTVARDLGLDIVTAFQYIYESVAAFEQRNSVKLPEGIASMLTPPQT